MILHRYSNIDYVIEMEWYDGVELVMKAAEKESEDRLFLMFVHDLSGMTFDEYKNKAFKKPHKKMNDMELESLLIEAENICRKEAMNGTI